MTPIENRKYALWVRVRDGIIEVAGSGPGTSPPPPADNGDEWVAVTGAPEEDPDNNYPGFYEEMLEFVQKQPR